MDYLKAFLVGGALCLTGQVLIDKTKLSPARILVGYVVCGVLLGALGVYEPLVDFAGAGASVPLTGNTVRIHTIRKRQVPISVIRVEVMDFFSPRATPVQASIKAYNGKGSR